MVKVPKYWKSCQDNVGLDFSFSFPHGPRDIRLRGGSYRQKELDFTYFTVGRTVH